MPSLQDIADAMVCRAQRQGYVVARDIRTELKLAGLGEDQWKDVVALAGPALHHRQSRYYHPSALRPQLRKEEQQQRVIQRVIRRLLKQQRAAAKQRERRGQERIDFILPVQVRTEGGKTFKLLCRDLSTSGVRILGTRRLLGHKVLLTLPQEEGAQPAPPCKVWVRILWTCAVGDDLFENGGMFLEIEADDGSA